MSLCRTLSRLSIRLKHFHLQQPCYKNNTTVRFSPCLNSGGSNNGIHTSSVSQDLMEFFDDKANWNELEVKVGRSWRVEELRIKSNSDLHKLWYVLLKERNMLLTMQHEYHSHNKEMPNPERIDKVEESMENLETVVRERNRAYFQLETGETGERTVEICKNCFGLEYKYKHREHVLEKRFNKTYWEKKKLEDFTTDHKYVNDFLRRLEEKKRKIAIYKSKMSYKKACELLDVFPNLDKEALRERFPNADIEKAIEQHNSKFHPGPPGT